METPTHSLLDSSLPVEVPYFAELYCSDAEFDAFRNDLFPSPGATAEEFDRSRQHALKDNGTPRSPFMDALTVNEARYVDSTSLAVENKMPTDNGDVVYRSSGNPVLDLYIETKVGIGGELMRGLLETAWAEDPKLTLKVLFHARSIHLGKGEQKTVYRALGWLYQEQPKTFLTNLKWLVPPTIEKKTAKGDDTAMKHEQNPLQRTKDAYDEDDEFTLIDVPEKEGEADHSADNMVSLHTTLDQDAYLVKYGGSHGYWKDLLDILALAANDQLRPDGDPDKVLNHRQVKGISHNGQEDAKRMKLDRWSQQHERVLRMLVRIPSTRLCT